MKGGSKNKRIFLDYASTTPLDPRVFKVMQKAMMNSFANPSALYEEGVEAKALIESARKKIADIIRAHSDEIVFTGSGTESDNLAIFGVFSFARSQGIKSPHFIVSSLEHPAVLEALAECENQGAKVTYVIPNNDGIVLSEDFAKHITKNTVLISCMFVNNEIGTIQPIREIAKAIRQYKKNRKTFSQFPYFHVDASQAVLFEKLSVEELHADLLTIDAQKMYGPKGIGALYIRRGTKISPRILGGGQEDGRRSGTENTAGIVGFAKAFEIATEEREKEIIRLRKLQTSLLSGIKKIFPQTHINGSLQYRSPANLNVCFPNADGEYLVLQLDAKGIAVSSSSSCRTLSQNSRSYVIEKIGSPECAESSIRFSLGRFTTKEDIARVLKILKAIRF